MIQAILSAHSLREWSVIANFVNQYIQAAGAAIRLNEMKQTVRVLMLVIAVALCGCSKKKQFVIQGEIEGLGAQIVNATYYAAGGLKRVSVVASENKFVITGESVRPTLLTVALGDGLQLATLIVVNGDKLRLAGDVAEPYSIKVSGNSDSEKIAEWVSENAALLEKGDAAALNRSIAGWVGRNKSSKAATALIVSFFRTSGFEQEADSLMGLLASSARTQEIVQNFTGALSAQLGEAASTTVGSMNLYDVSDSVVSVNPRSRTATLFCFMSADRQARDSVSSHIRTLTRNYGPRRFEAVEISSASDSAEWRESLKGDSATWRRTWAPATVASTSVRKLGIPRYPYFIVADSAGHQIYRGSSIKAAATAVENRFGH